MSGIVQFGNVTNSVIRRLQSGGNAYSLSVPFQPDMLEWYRYTTYGTAEQIVQGVWFRGFPDGDALNTRVIVDNGSTGNTNTVLETTNGVTLVATGGTFADQHLVISGATTAAPCVITTGTHGLADNDRVVITQIVGTIGAELNNKTFVVQVLSATTFALYDIYGAPIVTAGSYTSGGQATKTGPMLNVQQTPVTYSLTLGTSIMGTDNDVIYIRVSSANNYTNLGDVA